MKERVKTKIDYMGENFRCVAKLDGKDKLIIDDCLEGEMVTCEIDDKRGKNVYGKVIKIDQPSVYRIEPMCKHFNTCGFCALQYIDYKHQVELKKQIIESALQANGIICAVDGISSVYYPFRYRNIVSFDVEHQKGKIAIGYFVESIKKVMNIEECPVVERWVFPVLEVVRSFMGKFGITAYNRISQMGMLRSIHLECAGEKLMVILDVSQKKVIGINWLYKELKKLKTEGVSIWTRVFTDDNHYEPADYAIGDGILWTKKQNGTIVPLAPRVVKRVNEKIEDVLVKTIADFIDKNSTATVIGSDNGIFAMQLYKKGLNMVYFEMNKFNVKLIYDMDRKNREENSIRIYDDIEEPNFLIELQKQYASPLIIDVRGDYDDKLFNMIRLIKPVKMLTVFNNVDIMMNTIIELRERMGYRVEYIKPFDALPQTKQIQTLCVFSLNSNTRNSYTKQKNSK